MKTNDYMQRNVKKMIKMTPVTLTLTFQGRPSKNKNWPPERWPMPNFKPLRAILWSWQPTLESEKKKRKKKKKGKKNQEPAT